MVAAVLNWFAEFVRVRESERLQQEIEAARVQNPRPNPGLDISEWLSQRSE